MLKIPLTPREIFRFPRQGLGGKLPKVGVGAKSRITAMSWPKSIKWV